MRKPSILVMVAALCLGLANSASAGEKYDIDTVHSFIGFSVRHMAVANVRGEFKEYTAELMVDESDLTSSSIVLTIDASSIDTDNQRRDDHLRSADFLEVETYPEITFKSKRIDKAANGGYRATGDLTIHGVTREVVLEMEVSGPIKDPWGNHRIGIEGGVTIDRQNYDVKFSNKMETGELIVADEVRISFALEALRKLE